MPIPVPHQRSGPATFDDGGASRDQRDSEPDERDDRKAHGVHEQPTELEQLQQPRPAAPRVGPAGDVAGDSPDVPATSPAAAFFDLDNTLMRGASLFYLARGLWSRKFFSHRDVATALWQQTRFRVGGRENPGHLRS